MENLFEEYLRPGIYTNSDHPDVVAYAQQQVIGIEDKKEQVIALYYAIRDGFRYSPYHIILKPYALKASYLLTKDYGHCIEKSNLFAACVRSLGVPCRLGYGNVRNHLGTKILEETLKTDVLVYHGYAEVYLEGNWIKTTPVFNTELCHKLGVEPLDFDGEKDAIFQKSDKEGKPFMEYITDHGTFADLPFETIKSGMQSHYPHLFKRAINNSKFIFEFDES
ncbi:transglutaminase-like domain-containing protein [Aureispira anguillae]|uniref:Transglutaminase-like domain-containing protein n=1 Tax=Aureispira anguillae TaxID=2864201 RepID=A0A915YEU5_9BACT|nr:transglutaminase-like domain-containing protein [Aureispira anguillae]BDS11737.1 transglutaminase-like domain-containing protein [Aureispira anguillae]